VPGRVGRILDLTTGLAPALALVGWLLAGLPLLLVDHLRAAVAIPLAVVITVPLILLVAMWGRLPSEEPSEWPIHSSVPVVLTVVVAAGFVALAWTTSSEHVVVRRDPGVYAQTADWLAHHGRLPVPAGTHVFGAVAGLGSGSPGFYPRGNAVVPQFMSGTAVALTPAGWAAGLRGITRADAVVGGLALLSVAAFARRIGGAWCGLLTALTLAFVYPELHQARSAFSEPAAQLVLFGGLALLVDAYRGPRGTMRTAMHALAGLVVGIGVFLRIDALVELLPLIAAFSVWAVRGRGRDAAAAGAGVIVGATIGFLDGLTQSRPYLDTLGHELRLTAAAAVAVIVITSIAVLLHRRGTLRRLQLHRHLPAAGAALVVLAAAALYFIRPHLEHPRYPTDDPAANDVVTLQHQLGLPADGPRTYAEQSLHWVTWWLGGSGVVLGVVGLAVLLARALRGRDAATLPFLLIVLGTTSAVLARPSITPDHPWADRRFVPLVLPGLVVAAAWLVAVAVRRIRRHGGRRAAAVVAIAGVAALVAPAVIGSAPLLGRSTERGELSAVADVCASMPPQAAVLVTSARARDEWTQVIRGDCNVPVATITGVDARATARAAADAVRRNGRSPVVVGDTRDAVAAVTSAAPHEVVHLRTREADHQLTRRPTHTRPVTIELWLAAAD
jgi:hypothetical protein